LFFDDFVGILLEKFEDVFITSDFWSSFTFSTFLCLSVVLIGKATQLLHEINEDTFNIYIGI